MARQEKQRDRGHLLTQAGVTRLKEAIEGWEEEHQSRCTQEKIKELSRGLDPKTISKIRKCKSGTDVDSIKRLFEAFGLFLEDGDHHVPLEVGERSDCNFVGRESALADLNYLRQQNHRIVLIQAKGGVGKTTLAQQFFKTQQFDKILELWMAKETQNIVSVEGVIEEWLRRYFNEEPAREFGMSLERLRQKLRDPALRIGVLIDNLEPALDSAGRFVAEHRRYAELLRMLADRETHALTLVTSRERLWESAVSIETYPLSSLEREAWSLRFEGRQVQMDDEALTEIHRAYGGNAKAMEIMCSLILQDYQGNLAAYWQANKTELLLDRDLENLVSGQFERLREQDPDAYKLLCRMGCYRYQDVPTVSLDGLLCLLWDVPEHKRKRVVRCLQERSLADSADEKFWLHPVIKAVALEHLEIQQDKIKANQFAADFWTQSVLRVETGQDAKSAFEAYYHHIDNEDFQGASRVILLRRENNPDSSEPLSRSLYRFGLFSCLLNALKLLKYKEERLDAETLAGVYHISGFMSFFRGDIQSSIADHRRSGRSAKYLPSSEYKILSKIGLGYCYFNLKAINKAKQLFEECISESQDTTLHRYVVDVKANLALIHALKKEHIHALLIVEKISQELELADITAYGYGNALILIGLTYKEVGNLELAEEFVQKAINYSHINRYILLYGRSLYVLSGIQLLQEEIEKALKNCRKSIELLNEISADFELLQAHSQFGEILISLNKIDSKIDLKSCINPI